MQLEGLVMISYTNWRGEESRRLIRPGGVDRRTLVFEETEWHPGAQWILHAWDIDKNAFRSFAMKDIDAWAPFEEPEDGTD